MLRRGEARRDEWGSRPQRRRRGPLELVQSAPWSQAAWRKAPTSRGRLQPFTSKVPHVQGSSSARACWRSRVSASALIPLARVPPLPRTVSCARQRATLRSSSHSGMRKGRPRSCASAASSILWRNPAAAGADPREVPRRSTRPAQMRYLKQLHERIVLLRRSPLACGGRARDGLPRPSTDQSVILGPGRRPIRLNAANRRRWNGDRDPRSCSNG